MTALIPLYPDEATIALLVLGPKGAKDWPRVAQFLEDKHGLPRVDELMGGRFWPAVVAYFRIRHGMKVDGIDQGRISSRIRIVPFKPDGKDHFDEPPRPAKRRARTAPPLDRMIPRSK
jgi:hypothetical protein